MPNQLSLLPPLWRRGFLLLALGLLVGGVGLHASELAADWMLWAHKSPAIPEIIWSSLTILGSGWAVLILVSAMDRSNGAFVGAAMLAVALGGTVLNYFKEAWPQPRPSLALEPELLVLIGEWSSGTGSMPSGHAAGAAVLFTLLAIMLASQSRLTVGRFVAAGVFVAFVAWSRVAVGAHWPADILVGAGFGVCVALLSTIGLVQMMRMWGDRWRPSHRQRMAVVAITEVLLSLVCLAASTGQPSAWYLQVVLAGVALCSSWCRLRDTLLQRPS